MPRSILGTPVTRDTALSAGGRSPGSQPATRMAAPQLAQRLRQKRSARYIEQIKRLDTGTHQHNAAALQALLDEIATEFPELGIDQRPLGIVAKCYLGPPYEVHRCDLTGSIVEHYEAWRPMDGPYERARSLATHGSYQFIEIYADTVRAVSADGSVAVL